MSLLGVYLRTPQARYLRSLADREDITISRAMEMVIEQEAIASLDGNRPPPRKERMCFSLNPIHAAILGRLSIQLGLRKSDVARRLIDGAAANDF